jgi:regulator of sigma E protease
MVILENVVWVLVLIGVMILIHELGHFIAARRFDVRVEAFSFGFGPRLFGFRKGETDYRLSLIPFGGYVKMAGEQPGDDDQSDPRSFMAKPRWQRLIIAFAGPFANILLAVALLTGLYMVRYQRVSDQDMKPVIGHVLPDSPAAKAGVQAGDLIVKLEDKDHPTWEDIEIKEMAGAYRPMRITVQRGGRNFETAVTPVLDDRTGVGQAGWSSRGDIQVGAVSPGMPAQKAGLQKGDLIKTANGQPIHTAAKFHEIVRASNGKPVVLEIERHGRPTIITIQPVFGEDETPPRWLIGIYPEPRLHLETTRLSFPDALGESVRQNVKGATLIFRFLAGIIERRMSPKTLEGPIRIAQLSGEAAREGPSAYIMLMSMVSLNLAIFNLLPIPILDGGVILLLLIEMVMRRDMSVHVKETVFKLGFVFIMVLVAFVIYNDISKILPG